MKLKRVLYVCLMASTLLLCETAQADKRNLIHKIEITSHTLRFTLDPELHKKYLWEDFYVTYHDELGLDTLDYSIITMPILLNVFSIILISGQEYYVKEIDKDLYHSLSIVQEALKRLYPHTEWKGRLTAKKVVDNSKLIKKDSKTIDMAMPFSHGLDSICTSFLHRDKTQLLMTVRGCPDTPIDAKVNTWHITKDAVVRFAKTHGHTTSFVTSNFHEFFNWEVLGDINPEIMNWRMDTIEDLGWIGIAAPILVSKGIKQLVLAANKDWSTLHPGISSPITNNTMSFAGISVMNDAFDLSRTEKNFIVADICNRHDLPKPKMFVCEYHRPERKNCNVCTKCVFTILSWILAQEEPREYGFDVSVDSFLEFFRNTFFYENIYSPYRTGCFKYMQYKARQQLPQLNARAQSFFSWFLTIDFDKLTVPTNQIVIDYDDFIDLYPNMLPTWKNYRIMLEHTHVPGNISDEVYQSIWHAAQVKRALKRKASKRRVKKHS
ncbi:MAG: hypothetical protein AB7F19_03185 [Candidatus Babeliales bacterium]